jgi:hypothetical protein
MGIALCDVFFGPVEISGSTVICSGPDGDSLPPGAYSSVSIFGNTTEHFISVSSTTLPIQLTDVDIAFDDMFDPAITNPFIVTGESNVNISLRGRNVIRHVAFGGIGVRCCGSSTITFRASDPSGTLRALGGGDYIYSGLGIGPGDGDVCAALNFVSGRFDGGDPNEPSGAVSAIGSGSSSAGNSRLDSLVIDGGLFSLRNGECSRAVIGAADPNCSVGVMVIGGGDFSLMARAVWPHDDATGGAAIGTGIAEYVGGPSGEENPYPSWSRVDRIRISGGTFNILSRATGIGTGILSDGIQAIDRIKITGGAFNITAMSGCPAIGAGASSGVVKSYNKQRVESIDISGGRFMLASHASFEGPGAPLGSGSSSVPDGSRVERIQITGGSIVASGAPAIGSGGARGANATSSIGELVIGGSADVVAIGEDGVGIGAGTGIGNSWAPFWPGNSTVDSIVISGGRLTVTGVPAAIGTSTSGENGWVGLSPGGSTVGSIVISGGAVTASSPSAGIGAGNVTDRTNGSCVSLVSRIAITGGTVRASGVDGAGIGGAFAQGQSVSEVGEISISGGSVTASSARGAGIGTGFAWNGGVSSVQAISITGGQVFADSIDGAGIGSGLAHNGTAFVEAITIAHATVAANSSGSGAAIGAAGAVGSTAKWAPGYGTSSVGPIRIHGATINATAGDFGAAIGTGEADAGLSSVESVIVESGNLNLRAGLVSAGIGTGRSRYGHTTMDSIEIYGGNLQVVAGQAGIGTGYSYRGATHVGNITIVDGTMNVTGGPSGAGIGSGSVTDAIGTIRYIAIRGGRVIAVGGSWACGIGAGLVEYGISQVERLYIQGGILTTSGMVGVGSSESGQIGTLSFDMDEANVERRDLALSAPPQVLVSKANIVYLDCSSTQEDRWCVSADVLDHGGAEIRAITNTKLFFDRETSRLDHFSGINFYGQYRFDSQPEVFCNGNYTGLYFRELMSVKEDNFSLFFKNARERPDRTHYNRTVIYLGKVMKGMIVTLEEEGTYTIDVTPLSTNITEKLIVDGKTEVYVGAGHPTEHNNVSLQPLRMHKETISAGMISGLVIGGVLLLGIIVIGGAFVFLKIRRNQRLREAEEKMDERESDPAEDPAQSTM